MGAGNVVKTYAAWGHLPHAPFRLLVYMALVSKDADNPPRYFGGFRDLLRAYGRDEPSHSDRVTVTRAITVLRAEGAILGGKKGAPGRRAEYLLSFQRPETGQHDVEVHDNTMLRTRQHHVEDTTTPCCPSGERGTRGVEGGAKTSKGGTSLVVVAEPPRLEDLEVCPGCRFMRWEGIHASGCHYAGRTA